MTGTILRPIATSEKRHWQGVWKAKAKPYGQTLMAPAKNEKREMNDGHNSPTDRNVRKKALARCLESENKTKTKPTDKLYWPLQTMKNNEMKQ